MRQTRLASESPEYLTSRHELQAAEVELMKHRERVAELRRRLPAGPVVDRMADDIDQRGIDLLCPVWHLLDLTPQGRDDWYAELAYPRR